ncbi:hypothetical protein NDN08_005725 [Rhodosorus marinus]|uniref:Coilin n=1 Tax=Rhodosorus marinus TaxID=101924 RepID=A0AAV8V5G9_9RHOD|nr:hypothetical protein NDN08_005725 [Rhodosorus marinus]
MVGRKRIRLSQKKSLKSDGDRDIWVLAPEVESVRDLEQFVKQRIKWTAPVEFELNGASIPSSEAAEIIRDGDTLEVIRKYPSPDESIQPARRPRSAFAQGDKKVENSSGSLQSSSAEPVKIRSSSNDSSNPSSSSSFTVRRNSSSSPTPSATATSSASPSVSSSEGPKNEEVPIQITPSPQIDGTPEDTGPKEERGQVAIPKLSSSAKRRLRRKRIRETQRSQQAVALQAQPAFENPSGAIKGAVQLGELASQAKPASENPGKEVMKLTTCLEGHQADEASSKITTTKTQRTFVPSGSISGVLKRIQRDAELEQRALNELQTNESETLSVPNRRKVQHARSNDANSTDQKPMPSFLSVPKHKRHIASSGKIAERTVFPDSDNELLNDVELG